MPAWFRDQLFELFPDLRRIDGYVVGGAIRDLLRGEQPADVDVACIDPLSCAKTLGRRVIRLGREEHLSAWRVAGGGEHIYDFAAILDGDILADLGRRDFTINAMAVDLDTGELLDPFDGRGDLERRLVRMVAEENFDDDPLRVLKGVRMAVTLQFSIDEATIEAMRRRAPRIVEMAPERVTYELSIILGADRFREALRFLHSTALDVPLFGREIDASQFYSDDVPLAAALALLVSDPRGYARKWRWSSELLHDVTALRQLLAMEGDRRVALYDAGERVARQLPPLLRAVGRDEQVKMPDFNQSALLTGDEIRVLTGMTPGPELGRVKRALLEAQILGNVRTREEARALCVSVVNEAR